MVVEVISYTFLNNPVIVRVQTLVCVVGVQTLVCVVGVQTLVCVVGVQTLVCVYVKLKLEFHHKKIDRHKFL